MEEKKVNLSSEELDKVSGGAQIPLNIPQCIQCRATDWECIDSEIVDGRSVFTMRCKKCGFTWTKKWGA